MSQLQLGVNLVKLTRRHEGQSPFLRRSVLLAAVRCCLIAAGPRARAVSTSASCPLCCWKDIVVHSFALLCNLQLRK